MKEPSKWAALLLGLFLVTGSARSQVGYGFLNLANLVPGDAPCKIAIDGQTLLPDGLPAGEHTGWFMVKPGRKTLRITLGELDPASGQIEVVDGVENLIGIFLKPSEREEPDGTPSPPEIRIKRLPAYDSQGFGLRFVSLCPEKQPFRLGQRVVVAEAYEPVEVPRWTGRGFELFCGDATIGRVPSRNESGSFYLLVGTDLQGGYTSTLVSTDRQEVPDYLKPDESKSPRPTPNPENP